MMDHERTEKDLEEIFQEIQRHYKTLAEEAFALQGRTLAFARGLLEGTEGEDARSLRTTLEDLADKSRSERERFERLARKSGEHYMRVLRGPIEGHHHELEKARADLEEASRP